MIVIYLLLLSDAKFPPVISVPGYKPPKKCLWNNTSPGLISGILRYLIRRSLWSPIRVISFSTKHDFRFQDRSFDPELLFDFKLPLEVESLFDLELLYVIELLISSGITEFEFLLEFQLRIWYWVTFDLRSQISSKKY